MYSNVYARRGRPIGPNYSNNRFGGGFALPFLLGGITGGLLAPAFYPRPIPYAPYPYPAYPIYPQYPVYY